MKKTTLYGSLFAAIIVASNVFVGFAQTDEIEDISCYFTVLSDQEATDQLVAEELIANAPSPGPRTTQLTDAFKKVAEAYACVGDYQSSIEAYDQAIRMDSDWATLYYSRGRVVRVTGDYENALADFTTALELDPEWASIIFEIGYIELLQGEYETCVETYTDGLAIEEDAIAYNNRGVCYDNLDDVENAMADYERATEINPEYALAYDNLGLIYHNERDYEAALGYYSQAIELDPERISFRLDRIDVLLDMQEWDDAVEDLEFVLENSPDTADVYYYYGFYYFSIGEYAEAVPYYQTYLELDPTGYFADWADQDLEDLADILGDDFGSSGNTGLSGGSGGISGGK